MIRVHTHRIITWVFIEKSGKEVLLALEQRLIPLFGFCNVGPVASQIHHDSCSSVSIVFWWKNMVPVVFGVFECHFIFVVGLRLIQVLAYMYSQYTMQTISCIGSVQIET